MKPTQIILLLFLLPATLTSQEIPSKIENLEGFVVYGKAAQPPGGADQYQQHIYLKVPTDYQGKVVIRIFDPETGGQNDIMKGEQNTEFSYTLYGGEGTFWDGDLNNQRATGKGSILEKVVLGPESAGDNSYITLFSVDSREGEYVPEFDSWIFRFECQGQDGDDGNVFKVFLSTDSNRNTPIEGSNSFRYVNSCILHDAPETGHLFPYMESTFQNVEGEIQGLVPGQNLIMVSRDRRGQRLWPTSPGDDDITFTVMDEEIGVSLDFQLPGRRMGLSSGKQSICISLTSQSETYVKFYSEPIGGVPMFRYEGGFERIMQ